MKNANYKKDRQNLTDEQILKNKDFKSTLEKVNIKPNPITNMIKTWGIGGASVLAVVISIYFFNNQTENNEKFADEQADFTYKQNTLQNEITAIKPPFLDQDIPYEIFNIEVDKNQEITTKSGTKFFIPKNSLVDVNGNKISGTAQIQYRELRNPIDFFLSGIPMTYDSAGVVYHFESAGMLDIKAFQNDEKIALADGNSIDFQFNSTTAEDGFNFYSLNEETGTWTYDNQPISIEKNHQESKKINNQLSIKKEKIKKPIKQNKQKYSINLKVDKKNYPELEKYEGTIFEINEMEEPFDPLIYNVNWETAEISNSNTHGNYTLTLSRNDSIIKLTVYPVIKDEFYDKAITQYNQDKSQYIAKQSSTDFDVYETSSAPTVQQEITFNTIRTFSIEGFGIYNCDQPRYQPEMLAKKTLLDDNGEKASFNNYYVVGLKRNSLVNLGYLKGVRYYKKGESIVWFVNEKGQIAIIEPNQFEKINEINSLKFRYFDSKQGVLELKNLLKV
ncbi:MAG: hypothetical protein CO022_10380 [Flavobacteriales bacterium CG_4_9_14_0_2_um_filter_32_27]|nr:MAG: hypothetical protein CO022_10380 [Flavobacteriales bacterium CG_4_9_14_0_2_um_filter_32_27]